MRVWLHIGLWLTGFQFGALQALAVERPIQVCAG